MLSGLFRSKLRAKALGWLYTHPGERYYVRQLQSILNEDATNLGRELARLTDMGILTCQTRGQQKYYQANPDCPLYGELRGLATKTFGLADILRELLAPIADTIDVAFVFGSQAGGTATAASDVDLMVVGQVSFRQVVGALSAAHEKLGREVNPTVYPRGEFRTKLAQGNHFLKEVLQGDKIFLIGDAGELGRLA